MNVGDLVRDSYSGKTGIILEHKKRHYVDSYWVSFFCGFECWIDESNLSVLSQPASV